MDITYNKNKNSIKIWPYLDDISQAIIPYSDNHLSKKGMVVNIDFSCVKRINSSGATIALTKLTHLLTDKKGCVYKLVMPENQFCNLYLQNSGFLARLNDKFNLEQANLFESNHINYNLENSTIEDNINNVILVSFPIYHLKYDKKKDRICVDEFSEWVTDILIDNLSDTNIKPQINVLAMLLKEIAKNSQDHTGKDAYFGLDIVKNSLNGTGRLLFSFADLGIGITKNVKNNLPENSKQYRSAKDKFSYSDAYHFAFTLGNTTSKNPRNKGIGMSMIRDGVNMLNLDLTIWDGRSMLFIPKDIAHSELRRNVFDTSNPVGFYYYGRLEF